MVSDLRSLKKKTNNLWSASTKTVNTVPVFTICHKTKADIMIKGFKNEKLKQNCQLPCSS